MIHFNNSYAPNSAVLNVAILGILSLDKISNEGAQAKRFASFGLGAC
jgi:hypothetical protein